MDNIFFFITDTNVKVSVLTEHSLNAFLHYCKLDCINRYSLKLYKSNTKSLYFLIIYWKMLSINLN